MPEPTAPVPLPKRGDKLFSVLNAELSIAYFHTADPAPGSTATTWLVKIPNKDGGARMARVDPGMFQRTELEAWQSWKTTALLSILSCEQSFQEAQARLTTARDQLALTNQKIEELSKLKEQTNAEAVQSPGAPQPGDPSKPELQRRAEEAVSPPG